MLEGASVTTVEGIRPEGKGAPDLHPCQQVMVDQHASQCGFCTPGFVMSLFAAWCNGDGLAPAEIDTTLAGNLCRCTGYTQIVQAVELAVAEAVGTEPEPPAWAPGQNPWRPGSKVSAPIAAGSVPSDQKKSREKDT